MQRSSIKLASVPIPVNMLADSGTNLCCLLSQKMLRIKKKGDFKAAVKVALRRVELVYCIRNLKRPAIQ